MAPVDLTNPDLTLDDLDEFSPVQLANAATPETVAKVCELFDEALLDEQMPEAMRAEVRLRLAALAQRFPEQTLGS